MRRFVCAGAVALLVLIVVGGSVAPAGAVLTARYGQVAASRNTACAIAVGGASAICWGDNSQGQLGGGTKGGVSESPVAVKTAGTPLAGKVITQIAPGELHTCAVASGAAYCWGFNNSGELGTGTSGVATSTASAVAVKTSGTALAGKTVKQVSVGSSFSCALATDGTVACWGNDTLGKLGNGAGGSSLTAVAVTRTGTALQGRSVSQLSTSSGFTCAVTTDGNAACWGGYGSFGNGTSGASSSQTALLVTKTGTPLAGRTIKSISTFADHTCALATDGTLVCWGEGGLGQMGRGSTDDSTLPVAVTRTGTPLAGRTISGVAATVQGACAWASDGSAACWGANTWGGLGAGIEGIFDKQLTAVAVKQVGTALQGAKVTGIAGANGGCAVASDGRVACWGDNDYGELGRGERYGYSNVPVGVLGTGPFAPFTSFGALVTQQFRDLVGRSPSSAELASWVAQLQAGASGGDLVAALRASNENATNVDPVARLYWAYFNRIPDEPGLTYWIGRKRSGTSLSSISSSFAASKEFKTTYGSLSNGAFVDLVYENVLGRAPDSAGRAYWTGQLGSGAKTRGQVMVGFSESSEYRTKMARPVHVVVLFVALLERSPSTAELNSNVAKLAGGTTVAALAQGILTSGAYIARVT